jgi:hypothetical protein
MKPPKYNTPVEYETDTSKIQYPSLDMKQIPPKYTVQLEI